MGSTRGWLAAALSFALGACSGSTSGGGADARGPDARSSDASRIDSSLACDPACQPGMVCSNGLCVPDLGPCATDDDCQNDSYCSGGKCIPWGTGPKGDHDDSCQLVGASGPIGIFAPLLQCQWTAPPAGDPYPTSKQVLPGAAVVDFDFDKNPATQQPSIVFVTWDSVDSYQSGRGVVRVIDGGTCAQQHVIGEVEVRATSPVAIADLDLDGRPDVVAIKRAGGLVAFGYDPGVQKFKVLWSSTETAGTAAVMWDGPSVHDVNDDGKPEVLVRGAVYSNTGKLLDGALVFPQYVNGLIPVAADLDAKGGAELVNGAGLWTWSGGKWSNQWTGGAANPVGQVAIADFGRYGADPKLDDRSQLDGVPEVAVVSNDNTARVQTLAGRVVFGPIAIPGGGGGGNPPAIGDFDHDGRAELAVAGGLSFTIFDPDCAGAPQAATCASLNTKGVLWTVPGLLENDWGEAGSSAFDFENDGAAEVVYNDVCFLRVFDGTTGDVLFSQWHTSCTWYEMPIVVDTDGDGHSELVLTSNTTCGVDFCAPKLPKHPTSGLPLDPHFKGLRCKMASDCPGGACDAGFCRCTADKDCGGGGYVCAPTLAGTPGSGQVCRSAFLGTTSGINVYQDIKDRWAGSRTIWNQQAYSVTNINEDGSVPKTSLWKANWKQKGMNHFRQNSRAVDKPVPAADLTSKWHTEIDAGTKCDSKWVLVAKVCNRGAADAPAGIPGTFYAGDPAAGGQKLCTATTQQKLKPGACEVVKCEWLSPGKGAVDLWFVPDDDGTAKGGQAECKKKNNPAHIAKITCPGVVE